MKAKKTQQYKAKNPLQTVRVNISMTQGTSDVLKETADHRHVSVSALVTCLIRTEAERVGLLSLTVKDTRKKEVELESLPAAARAKSPKAK
tara:strand:- start:378 stop:650 length:273 start_codon:yes stop_codon:yes gene_type:complete